MSQQPIPRIALTWLLVAQALVILPHLEHLPFWVVGFWLGCAAWRVQVYRMRARYPNGLAVAWRDPLPQTDVAQAAPAQ